uniref:alpha-galactosidase n=1 Tax=Calcidiscus leptoporus TaxID=127549 RepID=A0A7S0IZT4_9EUKA
MTTSEYRCQFAIWALMKAPLLISTDVTNMSAATLEILSNTDVIAINQDALGVAGRLVEERPPDAAHLQVWAGPLSAGRVAVVLWNRGETMQEILGRFVNMQLEGSARVYDCLAHEDLGIASGQLVRNVSAHDVAVFVLTPTTGEHEDVGRRGDGGRQQGVAGGSRAWTAAHDAAWAARWRGHGVAYPQSRLAWEAEKQAGSKIYRRRANRR